VKRGASISLWDGRAALEPGDSLRLKVVAEGFRHVVVATPGPDRRGLVTLYAGPVAATGSELLPTSFRVDDSPGPERLTILLGRKRLTPAELARISPGTRTSDLWTIELVLAKTITPKDLR
jgi:hypothetical protein